MTGALATNLVSARSIMRGASGFDCEFRGRRHLSLTVTADDNPLVEMEANEGWGYSPCPGFGSPAYAMWHDGLGQIHIRVDGRDLGVLKWPTDISSRKADENCDFTQAERKFFRHLISTLGKGAPPAEQTQAIRTPLRRPD